MAQLQQGSLLLDHSGIKAEGARIAIVYTEWNEKIVAEQIKGAHKIIDTCGATAEYFAVPGSFEIPFACRQIALKTAKPPDAIIAFGAVIRGGTPHFEYVCKAVTEGITQLNVTVDIPVIFGVLTLDNEQQAWERLGGVHGHKGEEAAITALKMIQLNSNLNKS